MFTLCKPAAHSPFLCTAFLFCFCRTHFVFFAFLSLSFSIFALLQAVVERRAVERRLTRIISDNKESEAALNKELRDAKHERNIVIAQLRHLKNTQTGAQSSPCAILQNQPVDSGSRAE